MKRMWKVVLGLSLCLPLVATTATCDNTGLNGLTAGQTFLKLFANPECLAKYGPLAGL